MVPTTMAAADTKKGAVLKADASKAPGQAAAAKTPSESSKKPAAAKRAPAHAPHAPVRAAAAAEAVPAKKVAAKSAPVPAQKSSKAGTAKPASSAGVNAATSGTAKPASAAPSKPRAAAASKPASAAPSKPASKADVKAPVKPSTKHPISAKQPAQSKPASASAGSPKPQPRPPASVAGKSRPEGRAAAPKPAAGPKPAVNPKPAPAGMKASQSTANRPGKTVAAPHKVPGRAVSSGAARPGVGLGAKAAPAKRITEGYVKDERFLASQRTALERERATYLEQAASLKAEAESLVEEMEPGDIQFDDESGEGGTVTVDRERDLALSAQALAAVEEIDHALVKMNNGTYGICENCGRLIPKARLEALPYARLCIDCKSGGLSRR